MGLDMYLARKTYVQNWDHDSKTRRYYVSVKKNGKASGIDPKKVTYVTEEVAYWRKANAIHRWFVVNVQKGEDDCGEYRVTRDQLLELVGLCERVLEASKLVPGRVHNGSKSEGGKMVPIMEAGKVVADPSVAQTLLPTTEGFFFGGTGYDQYYVSDIKETVAQLKKALAVDSPDAEFYYSSSW
jgi:hypothetical protein